MRNIFGLAVMLAVTVVAAGQTPAPMWNPTASGSATTSITAPSSLMIFSQVHAQKLVMTCDLDSDGKPINCKLADGCTLDEAVATLWKQMEDQQAFAQQNYRRYQKIIDAYEAYHRQVSHIFDEFGKSTTTKTKKSK